jgi:hypothetical protein
MFKKRQTRRVQNKRTQRKRTQTKRRQPKRKQMNKFRRSKKQYGGDLNTQQLNQLREIYTSKGMNEEDIQTVLAKINRVSHVWAQPGNFRRLLQDTQLQTPDLIMQSADKYAGSRVFNNSILDGYGTDNDSEGEDY